MVGGIVMKMVREAGQNTVLKLLDVRDDWRGEEGGGVSFGRKGPCHAQRNL